MAKKKPAAAKVQTESKPVSAEEDEIFGLSDAAKKLGVVRGTLARWCDDGVIAYGRHPSGVRGIRQSVIDAILREFPIGKIVSQNENE